MKIFKEVNIEKATKLLKWAMTFRFLMFVMPIISLFYIDKGLSANDVLLIQGIFALFIFFAEVPTGYIGDIFCRKKVLSIAFLFAILRNIIWVLSNGFWSILIGQLFLGVAVALISGTMDAYLYDLLKKQGKENSFMKQKGALFSQSNIAAAFSAILGGVVFKYGGTNAPAILNIICLTLGFLLIQKLPGVPEAKRKLNKSKSKLSDIFDIVKYTSKHPEIRMLIIISAIIGSLYGILFWSLQPLMVKSMVPVIGFGLFIGTERIFKSIIGHNSHHLYKKFKTKGSTIIVALSLLTALLFSIVNLSIENQYITYLLILLYILFISTQASLKVIMSGVINKYLKPTERATILSIKEMIFRISAAISLISSKFLIDVIGMKHAFMVIAILFCLILIYPMTKFLKTKFE